MYKTPDRLSGVVERRMTDPLQSQVIHQTDEIIADDSEMIMENDQIGLID